MKNLALYLLLGLLFLSCSRIMLTWWQSDRLSSLSQWWPILTGGLRIDISLLLQLAVIPFLGLLMVQVLKSSGRIYNWFVRHYYPITLIIVVFFELATPTFITEYDTRPDRLFIEYLVSPNEVFGMLVNGYLLSTLMILGSTALFSWFYTVYLSKTQNSSRTPAGQVWPFCCSWCLFLCSVFAPAYNTVPSIRRWCHLVRIGWSTPCHSTHCIKYFMMSIKCDMKPPQQKYMVICQAMTCCTLFGTN